MRVTQEHRDAANDILKGVVSISKHEMLIHGTYVTPHIVDQRLAARGAVCGGRQACLIGSVALAATPVGATYRQIDRLVSAIQYSVQGDALYRYGYYATRRQKAIRALSRNKPAKLAMEALNAEALALLQTKRQGTRVVEAQSWKNPAEGYFEVYLKGFSKERTHEAIKTLCAGARKRIKAAA